MEYYWTLYDNRTNGGSSGASNVVRGQNGHSNNPAWEPPAWASLPGNYHLQNPFAYAPKEPPAARNPDPNLTDLKLGKRHYFEEAAADSTPAKSGKAYCGGSGLPAVVPRCQVEGCGSVLVAAKEYHRRHKVCEVHAKAPRVVVLGIEQRFCQQCSRFHALAEFDESKRSCRRRLAGHNQRRRKSSQEQHSQDMRMMVAGRHPHLLNSSECALSLLSSSANYNPWGISPPSDDLPARCSAALRELIAEKRASVLARRQLSHMDECSDNTYAHNFSRPGLGLRGNVTLDLMQDPGSDFGLLSVHGHKAPKEGNEEDGSELWRVPLGY